MTTLQLRRFDDRTMILTDHRGEALPGQVAVAWRHGEPGQRAEVDVTFVIDGTDIAVTDQPVDTGAGTLAEAASAYAALSPANRDRFLTMHGLADERIGLNGRQELFGPKGERLRLLGEISVRRPGEEIWERVSVLSDTFVMRDPRPYGVPSRLLDGSAYRRVG